MLRNTQQQKHLQRLSPQQIKLMKLLQLPSASLEERIKEEMEENPALEYAEEGDDGEGFEQEGEEREDGSEETAPAEEIQYDDSDVADFIQGSDDFEGGSDYPAESTGSGVAPGDYTPQESTLHDHLLDQIGLMRLDEKEAQIAEQIIGSLDDDGYLRREVPAIVDDLAFGRNIMVQNADVEEMLGRIRRLDPPGICALDLQDCLLLQAERLQPRTADVRGAILLLKDYFPEFTRRQFERIRKGADLSEEALKAAIDVIVRLSPKPGAAYALINKAETYIVPDFYVNNNGGVPELRLHSDNHPSLRVSGMYREMLEQYDGAGKKDARQKETTQFVRQKIDGAKWFMDAIAQRQHTLKATMRAIMAYQKEFFRTGDVADLRPMVLRNIAEKTGYDISTISRVANSKYVQTEFGTFLLKSFFSEGLHTESGEDVSTHEVRAELTALIENEDKRNPYSDDKLMELLNEKGYNIARRTVAKYREGLGIGPARLRRAV